MNIKSWIIVAVISILPSISVAQTRGITLTAVDQKTTTPNMNGGYRALIIGNNSYQDRKER